MPQDENFSLFWTSLVLLLPDLNTTAVAAAAFFFFLFSFLIKVFDEPPSQQTSNSTSTLRARLLQLSKKKTQQKTKQKVEREGEENQEIKAFLVKVATTHTSHVGHPTNFKLCHNEAHLVISTQQHGTPSKASYTSVLQQLKVLRRLPVGRLTPSERNI